MTCLGNRLLRCCRPYHQTSQWWIWTCCRAGTILQRSSDRTRSSWSGWLRRLLRLVSHFHWPKRASPIV